VVGTVRSRSQCLISTPYVLVIDSLVAGLPYQRWDRRLALSSPGLSHLLGSLHCRRRYRHQPLSSPNLRKPGTRQYLRSQDTL